MAWDGHPDMLIFDEFLLECFEHPHMHPGSTLISHRHTTTDHEDCPVGRLNHPAICFWGSIFKDGEFVYRIGEYDLECNCWHARWPD